MHQIAHVGFIDLADIPRFKSLYVRADLSPIIWYPSPSSKRSRQPPLKAFEPVLLNRDLLEAGVRTAAASDWPVVSNPDPWLGIEGMVTWL